MPRQPAEPDLSAPNVVAADHRVLFYGDEAGLTTAAVEFCAAALSEQRTVLVLATAAHREAFSRKLRARGADLRHYRDYDAATLLAKIRPGEDGAQERFRQTMDPLVTSIDPERPVAIFGELVAVLAEEGKTELALRLEQWWNQLQQHCPISLYCAYPMPANGESAGFLERACDEHAQVITSRRQGEAAQPELTRIQRRVQRLEAEGELRQQASEDAEMLNEVARVVSSGLELPTIVQEATDCATRATGAAFGALFYTESNAAGESYRLFSLSGLPRSTFEPFGQPHHTALFGPVFRGQGPLRIGDVLQDARYGRSAPHYGLPAGHPPVRSFMGVPVVSSSGAVLGAMLFGHPEADVFDEHAEQLAVSIARQTALAMDNAHMHAAALRQAAQARQDADRLRAIFDASAVGVIEFDLDTRLLRVNAAFCTITGYSEAELLRMDCTELTHPDDLPLMQRLFQQLLSGEVPNFVYEKRYRRKSGETMWVRKSVSLTREETGRPLHFVGLCEDISARRSAEELLRVQSELLVMIADERPQDECMRALCVAAPRIVPDTKAAVLIAEGEGDSARVRSAIAPDLPAAFGQGLQDAAPDPELGIGTRDAVLGADVANDRRWPAPYRELCMRCGIGAMLATPIRDAHARAWGSFVLCFAQSRQPGERALELVDFGARMAALVFERGEARRVRAASEAALRQSEKIAAVGRLASTVAHEINNPLQAVSNLIYLAHSEEGLPPRTLQYLKSASDELARAALAARQTVGVHRGSGQAPKWVDAGAAVRDLLEIYGYKLRQRMVDVQAELQGRHRVLAAPTEFRQVVTNLLINALEALPSRGGRLRLRVSASPRFRKGGIRVTIADNGGGISSPRRIFEPFYTTKKDTGTGLGLWITQEIVARHHGRIQIRTSATPGHSGTTFSVLWPSGPAPGASLAER
ncbi:MAG: PAS domain S-box protein [Terriglobales bacterium]